jgi:hypothetical protein
MQEPRKDAGEVGRALVRDMDAMTWDRNGEKILANAARNRKFLDRGQSIAALRGADLGKGDSAIVVAAGPSIRRHDPAATLRHSSYDGAIIATDSGIAYCLRNGIVPDIVVSLDPDATRIVRWFGDPSLDEDRMAADDYFRRQDMDDRFADELKANRELMALMEKHGRNMRIALSTSASQAVVDRVLDIGMDIYWWNPLLDDPDLPDSASRKLYEMNGLPCMNAGGNVGAACWMMADAILGKSEVILVGVDFSYYSDTSYERTQYYHEIVDLVGPDKLDEVFMWLHNPHLDAWFYTDPAYMWYREAFLEMIEEADCRTVNCTEGGILFGDGIEFIPLKDALKRRAAGA